MISGNTGDLGAVANTKPLTITETILHMFPTSVIDSMARGDVLQIVTFSVIFALALAAAGPVGKPVLEFCTSLNNVMFRFADLVMKLAPAGVAASMAVTVSHQGIGVLLGWEARARAVPRPGRFYHLCAWHGHMDREGSAPALHPCRARALHARLCLRQQ